MNVAWPTSLLLVLACVLSACVPITPVRPVSPPKVLDAGSSRDAGAVASDAGECERACRLDCPAWFGDGGSCIEGCKNLQASGIAIDFDCLAHATCDDGLSCFH